MKNSNNTIGNRSRNLPACSEVPQPTAPPRPPLILYWVTGIIFDEQHGSLSFLLCSLLHSLVTLSLLGPNTVLPLHAAYFFPFPRTAQNLTVPVTHCLIAYLHVNVSCGEENGGSRIWHLQQLTNVHKRT